MKKTMIGKPGKKTLNGRTFWRQRFYTTRGTTSEKRFKTKNEALEWVEHYGRGSGIYETSMPRDYRLKDLFRDFLAACEKGRDGDLPLSASTVRAYRSYINAWLLPRIGNLRLEGFRKDDMRELRDFLIEKCKTRRTAQAVFNCLKTSLKWASDEDIISQVPGGKLTITLKRRAQNSQIEIFSQADMAKLEQAAFRRLNSQNPTIRKAWKAHYVLFLVLSRCGLRIGEALALKWKALSDDYSSINISESIDIKTKGATVEDRLSTPKSFAGNRTIPLPPILTDALVAMRDEKGPNSEDFVFHGRGGPQNPKSYHHLRRDMWEPLLDDAGVEHRGFHALRHYYASLWMAAGRYKEASVYLGHSDPAFTMKVYGHLIKDDGDHLKKMRQLIGDSFPTSF